MRQRLKRWWCRWFHQCGWLTENTNAHYCPICKEYRDL